MTLKISVFRSNPSRVDPKTYLHTMLDKAHKQNLVNSK